MDTACFCDAGLAAADSIEQAKHLLPSPLLRHGDQCTVAAVAEDELRLMGTAVCLLADEHRRQTILAKGPVRPVVHPVGASSFRMETVP